MGRESTPAPATAVAPTPEALAKAIRELGDLLRVTASALHRFTHAPEVGDLAAVIERRVSGIEALLGAAE